ncbi:MAG: PhzF family phenazine biosynthesis protein [Candidatus Nanopelagicales bacterium]
MRVPFLTCDVFTDTRFGGNPLAVLPDATGLSDAQMQQVAREFNYSESTFVLPAERGYDRRVRIFTPTREVPFAGHPNVGTAFALAASGALGEITSPRTVTFEQAAGVVPVWIEPRGELGGEQGGEPRFWCELTAPEPFTHGEGLSVGPVAAALGLAESDIVSSTHAPVMASVGLPFTIVEVADLEALSRAQADLTALAQLAAGGVPGDVHLYTRMAPGGPDGADDGLRRDQPAVDLRARMFAPFDGVPEDPATGSANCALVALLAATDPARSGDFRWRIAQGVEMGRPSLLEARATTSNGHVIEVRIGGESVLVSEGTMEI